MLPSVKLGDEFEHRTITPGEAVGAQRPNVFTVVGEYLNPRTYLVLQAGGLESEAPTEWDPVSFHETFRPLPAADAPQA